MGKELRILSFKKVVLFQLLLFVAGTVFSQSVVKGRVSDPEGNPLIGATVVVESTSEGTSTDHKGEFSFRTAKTVQSEKISISYMGYQQQLVQYSGNFLNIVLKDNSVELDNLVVTALGIKREEKSLGYATKKLEGTMVSETNPANWQ